MWAFYRKQSLDTYDNYGTRLPNVSNKFIYSDEITKAITELTEINKFLILRNNDF